MRLPSVQLTGEVPIDTVEMRWKQRVARCARRALFSSRTCGLERGGVETIGRANVEEPGPGLDHSRKVVARREGGHMTVSSHARLKSRKADSRRAHDALAGAALFVVAIAIIPIVFALFSGGGPTRGTSTAFASASAGNYALVATMNRTDDAIFAVPTNGGAPMQIVDVPHLDGFGSNGAVSPDGQRLALVTVDAGSPANPGASLLVVDLGTAAVTRLAVGVDPQQTPTWSPDGRSVVISRLAPTNGEFTDVSFSAVAIDLSGERSLWTATSVLGAYAVGFDPGGRFLGVAIDARGSTLFRDGQEVFQLSTQITRDWRLSPDGSQLAFVESDVSNGLRYIGRVVSLAGDVQRSAIQAGPVVQSLGVAWAPGGQPTFGQEPNAVLEARGQSAAVTGFDIPLSYSADGSALAVQHWSGSDFSDPGQLHMEMVVNGERTALSDFARFYGWTAR